MIPLRYRPALEGLAIPVAAIAATMVVFGAFILAEGRNPLTLYALMAKGAFGTWFSWQNTLTRAAPLMLTALCTALPARIGLVIIGGEGALALGGLAAAAMGLATISAPIWVALPLMALAGMLVGGLWIALAGFLRQYRGVNETISSLLLGYIAIALLNHIVEGVLRDPESRNKPSTRHIGEDHMLGGMFGSDVHWGLGLGVVMCVIAWLLMNRSVFGFAASMVGGNLRAARLCGLPVGRITVVVCALAGAAAGLAGMVEVAAVHGRANASLVAGYGYTGILVAFLARHQPLAIMPVAVLLGGIIASGGLLQRRLGLPDATVQVLEGTLFIAILASETLYGRFAWFRGAPAAAAPEPPVVAPPPAPAPAALPAEHAEPAAIAPEATHG